MTRKATATTNRPWVKRIKKANPQNTRPASLDRSPLRGQNQAPTNKRSLVLGLEDDVFVSGNIVLEEVESITIQTGTIGAPEQKIARKRIVSRSPSPLSIMPAALLNTLDKEQILDLLAFVLADGNADSLSFKKEVPPQK